MKDSIYIKNMIQNKHILFYSLMKFFFLFYIITFPLGIALREIGAIGSTISLILYYLFDFKNSNLKKWNMKWIYFIFLIYIFINVFFISINVKESWYALSHNLYKGFSLILVGLEFIREEKDLQLLVIVFAIMGFYEGLDGVWQKITGYDLIHKTPYGGRLTGSLSTPRVGNLMSLVTPIIFGYYIAIKNKIKNKYLIIFSHILLLIPALYLLYGSKTRSAWFGFFVAMLTLIYLKYGWNWKKSIFLISVIVLLLCWGPRRIQFSTLIQDPRFELWNTALKIFHHYPLTGSGFNTYPNAFKKLGITHKKNSNHIPHPHNIYLQFLCEGGVIGLLLGSLFLIGNFWWCLQRLKKINNLSIYYKLGIFFCASYGGYIMTAFSAHNYFRTWWLGMAMSIIGINIGIAITSHHKTCV